MNLHKTHKLETIESSEMYTQTLKQNNKQKENYIKLECVRIKQIKTSNAQRENTNFVVFCSFKMRAGVIHTEIVYFKSATTTKFPFYSCVCVRFHHHLFHSNALIHIE